MVDKDLLFHLLNSYGVSGFEDRVRQTIAKQMQGSVDKMYVDKLGNLICYKKGKKHKKPKIMLAAHMDEIGLIVKEINEAGKIFFSLIGGIEPITLVGQKVHIETTVPDKPLHGIISFSQLHNGKEISNRVPSLEKLYIDTGIGKKQLLKSGVKVGNFVVPEQKAYFAGSKDFISGKSLDDRLGCYALISLAKKLKKLDKEIYYVFTVQEEIGLYGAKTSAYALEPDIAIAVDVTNANDAEASNSNCVGKGPFLTLKDSEMISSRALNNHLQKLAKNKKIPLQLEVTDSGTTDAMYISISRSGVPSTVLGVPVRNIHSTISLASIKDVENWIKLLEEFLKNPPKVSFSLNSKTK